MNWNVRCRVYETWINGNGKITTVPVFWSFKSNLQYLVYVVNCKAGLVIKFTTLRKFVVELLPFLYLGLRSYTLTAQTKNKLVNLHWRDCFSTVSAYLTCTRVRACDTLQVHRLIYCAVACAYALTLKDSVTFKKKPNCLKCLPHIKNLSWLILLNDTLNFINYSSSTKHLLKFGFASLHASIYHNDRVFQEIAWGGLYRRKKHFYRNLKTAVAPSCLLY